MSYPAIEVVDITKRYESESGLSVRALRGTSLTINSGEMVSIVGRSGSGKSTLLHVMSGLTSPSQGTVFIHGQDLAQLSESQVATFRNTQMGFVFQSFFLEPTLRAWENVSLPLIVQKMGLKERKERASLALNKVGLRERFDHKPSELSGGEAQRVCIARAIVADPGIIFADEPTGNLDQSSGEMVMGILRDLSDQGTTVVMVTHNREDAALCDRFITVADGRIV